MKLDLELTPAQKNVARWGLVSGVAVAAIGLGIAFAAPPINTDWIAKDKQVSASLLAGNLVDLQKQITELQATVATLTNADPACPSGYANTTDSTITAGQTLCVNGADQVVKVGRGASAFWVDRFEASVWNDFATPVTPYGAASDNYPATFPDTGNWTAPVYAVSKEKVMPSAFLTWFQANAACRASGKRLPNGAEWLAAAKGTVDDASCNTAGTAAMQTNPAGKCVSHWGAQDMIGNVWEWTDEWYAGTANPGLADQNFGAEYNGDGVDGITGTLSTGGTAMAIPAGAHRGGGWGAGTRAGIFALSLSYGPTFWHQTMGFRCVLPRSH